MNHSYRAPIYGGGMNVPGAPGNLGGYAGLPETINEIERQKQEYQRMQQAQSVPAGFQNKYVS